VGHTLGLSHNYYDSQAGRISVMDYPHPLVMEADGTLDVSQVYAVGIGEWDKVAIAYGYQDFPGGADEGKSLGALLDDAWARDLRFLTNQDIEANPRVDQWSNGTDPAAELIRMMRVRRAALSRFGDTAIKRGVPMATLEEALVPLYLHHRYQVEAAASALGGQHYIYALRGDGRQPTRPVPAAEQKAALGALAATLAPAELALPPALLARVPPRPQGYGAHRELFPRYTGSTFDAITPAVVAASLTIASVLDAERAARLVQQHAVDPALPGLEDVLDALTAATFGAPAATAYEAELTRATERVLVEQLMALASSATMPQVRAVAAWRLERQVAGGSEAPAGDDAEAAHRALLVRDIKRFLDRPLAPAPAIASPQAPPGAPIGEPAMSWLEALSPPCGGWRPGGGDER